MGFLALVAIPSLRPVRGFLTLPLYVCDEIPSAEAAYVMADGHAYWGRLQGAADLFHMGKIQRILIRHEESISLFNFTKGKNDLLYERAIDYLVWKGVPRKSIETIPASDADWLSSLGEAKQVVKTKPELRSIVIVTSAPHTRRSRLCFQRCAPEDWHIQIYSPSEPVESWEINDPIWLEYLKLTIYWVCA